MAQRDYVRRGQPTPARRKTSTSRKKQRSTSSVNPIVVAIAAIVLVAFISGLWFITHHKKEESRVQPGATTGNGLPPKPEERWRYIKELESRQPGVLQPTEPSAGGEIKNQNQLTNEQRQLLEQMQADMRQRPTQLNEVLSNEQSSAQRQQRQQAPDAQHNFQQNQPVITHQAQKPRVVTQQPKITAPQPNEKMLQTSPHSGEERAKTATPTAHEAEPAKRAEEKKDERRWMVQCGSFKGREQAESVRAQLAFEGFDSHITTNNGWNRVVIGPLKGKDTADNTLGRLKLGGHSSCIRLAAGG